MRATDSYEVPYPSSRQLTFDLGHTGLARHHVRALLEVDLTEARTRIKQLRRIGTHVSLFSWLVKVIADCVALHPLVGGINEPRHNRVVVFNDVDVSIVVEKDVHGTSVPLPYVIRKASEKTPAQIRQEIESAQSQNVADERDYVLGENQSPMGMKLFVRLPQWLRLFLMRVVFFNNPHRMQQAMGTVMITTVGLVGHTRGWIVPFAMHPLCVALGTLNEQPAVYQGEIMRRALLFRLDAAVSR